MQILKLNQYEEKINSLREEKVSLEKQLALSHSAMTQLQQQNSSLVAEIGEPQRRLLKLHEASFFT
jgi:predicted  nucleic acid-binding Zn-ribbon protein